MKCSYLQLPAISLGNVGPCIQVDRDSWALCGFDCANWAGLMGESASNSPSAFASPAKPLFDT